MHELKPDTDQLLAEASAGDRSAAFEVLQRCRPRLRQMVAVRLDSRLSARVDPSDVVQEALADALKKLPDYLQSPSVSFYPWLRSIAWERIVKLHRRHMTAARRSVHRERGSDLPLPDESAAALLDCLPGDNSEPAERAIRTELQARAIAALNQLNDVDRDLLAMRYLEHMPTKEIAETLSLTPAATRMRHLRALEQLERILSDNSA